MQKKKIAALAGVTLLSVALLAACGGSKKTDSKADTQRTFSYVFTSDPTTFDYLLDNKATNANIHTNFIDGLMENDKYGNLVPSLAEDWTVSKDGLTYTYKLRKDVKWVTANGEEYAEVKAQDFVTGMKYAADNESLALYIVQDSIKGLDDYVKGKNKDFSSVGVKAVDDYTVQYTLNKPETFWNSKTTMGIMFPVNEEFLKSKGKDFGKVSDPNSILYNGAYTLQAITSKSSIQLTKNEAYWDVDNVNIDEVKLTFWDSQDQSALIKGFEKGSYDAARVFPNSSTYSEVKDKYGKNINYSSQDATVFYAMFNLDRQSYNMSTKNDKQKADTKQAVKNKDFRQAINFAFDRVSYNAQSTGKDGATYAVRTAMVPTDFVAAGDKTFGELTEKYIVEYGDQWKDVSFQDAKDGVYNKDKAKAAFAKAKEALSAKGVSFPVHLDVPVIQENTTGVAQAQSFKQFIEDAIGKENVSVDLQMKSQEQVLKGTFNAENASQVDYDISLQSGWGPDFTDPSTYLDIMNANSEGTMTYTIGLDGGKNSPVAKEIGFDEYAKMLDEANAETKDVAKRYDLYAKAHAWLLDQSVIVPYVSKGGTPSVTKLIPFQVARANVGIKGDGYNYKFYKIQKEAVTTEEYDKLKKEYLEEKAKSNAKVQEELADHVEK